MHRAIHPSCRDYDRGSLLTVAHRADAREFPFAGTPPGVPDGQISDPPVQPFSQKDSGVLFTQITSISIAIPSSLKGRIAIVTDVGRGMRWTRQCQAGEVRARRMALSRTAKSCGPDAPTLASSSREASFLGATVANKPGHRGEREISR
jgi:hypothetical protein